MFQGNNRLSRYVLTLICTLLISATFFLWMYVAVEDKFSTLMSDYGFSLLTYFGVLVVVVPLVTALTTLPQSHDPSSLSD